MNTKFQRVYEVALVAEEKPGIAEILRKLLLQEGLPAENIIESVIDRSINILSYFNSRPEAEKIVYSLRKYKIKNVTARVKEIQSKDWQTKWKEDFKPFTLTPMVDVAPEWERKTYKPVNRKIIYIDTVLAFGTGMHETTRFVAHLIESCRGKFQSFLDIGTGSGILSILAFIHGASYVAAIDIDKSCLEVAKTNLKVNNYKFNQLKAIDVADYKSAKQFDFVASNLISHDLIRLKKKILSLVKPKGFWVISGVSLENYPKLEKEFEKLPLKQLVKLKGSSWVAVLYQKFSK